MASATTKPAPKRKFEKVTTFPIDGGVGSVRVAKSGAVRLELPGRWVMESMFPGRKAEDAMYLTLAPRGDD